MCTEMEISYWPQGGSIMDFSMELAGVKVGVSVTRAFKYVKGAPLGVMTEEEATHLLTKKLEGVNNSTRLAMDKWSRQVLFVWTPTEEIADTMRKAWTQLDDSVKGTTLVLLVVANDADFIFLNGY